MQKDSNDIEKSWIKIKSHELKIAAYSSLFFSYELTVA